MRHIAHSQNSILKISALSVIGLIPLLSKDRTGFLSSITRKLNNIKAKFEVKISKN